MRKEKEISENVARAKRSVDKYLICPYCLKRIKVEVKIGDDQYISGVKVIDIVESKPQGYTIPNSG